MSRIHAAASKVIDAQPEEIYAILVDYRTQHPQILPKKYFKSLEIEAGGQGAGTIFRTRVRTGGLERSYHMVVSEPKQGLLVEKDMPTGLTTSFTVKPVGDGKQASVEIATEWESKGIQGFFEGLMAPPTLRRIYLEELAQLADLVKNKHAAGSMR